MLFICLPGKDVLYIKWKTVLIRRQNLSDLFNRSIQERKYQPVSICSDSLYFSIYNKYVAIDLKFDIKQSCYCMLHYLLVLSDGKVKLLLLVLGKSRLYLLIVDRIFVINITLTSI